MYKYRNGHGNSIPSVITGNFIAHKRLTKLQRAEIAGALMDDWSRLGRLNQRQLADLLGVSLAYARKKRRPQSAPQLQAAE
jgi:hypothetical protein